MEFDSIHKALNTSGFDTEPQEDIVKYVSPTLSKGHLMEVFGHNHTLSAHALGSEIKQGLEKVLVYVEKEKSDYYKEMQKAMKEAGSKPEARISPYITQGLDAFIENMPKCFSYKKISDHIQAKRKDDAKYSEMECPMYRYNEAAKEYVKCCVEKIYANAMAKGLEESRTYYLSVRQATSVGIGS